MKYSTTGMSRCGYMLTSYSVITPFLPQSIVLFLIPWYVRPCFKAHISPIHKSRLICRHRRPIARGRSRFGGPNCKSFAPALLLSDRNPSMFRKPEQCEREMKTKFKKITNKRTEELINYTIHVGEGELTLK